MIREFYRQEAAGVAGHVDARVTGRMIIDVLSSHPMMLIRGQILNNRWYVEPEGFLGRFSART